MNKATLLMCAVAAGATSAMAANAAMEHKTYGQAPVVESVKAAVAPMKTDAKLVEGDMKYNASSVKATTLSASYDSPEGVYTLGLSSELRGYSVNIKYGPAYTPLTWINQSKGATSYLWTFYDPEFNKGEDGKVLQKTSTEKDLTLSYPWSSVSVPTLAASDGTNTETFDPSAETSVPRLAYYIFGGQAEASDSQGNVTETGMTMYDKFGVADGDGYRFSTGAIYAYMPGQKNFKENGTNTNWDTYVSQAQKGSDACLTGFGMVFSKPASTYSITKLWAWINVVATKATQLKAEIYRIDDEGKIANEVLASGVANITAGSTDVPVFSLKSLDEDGFEIDDPINIDSSILVIISGFSGNDAITSVTPTFGVGNTYAASEKSPYARHAVNVIEYKDADGKDARVYAFCPWSYYTDDSKQTLMAVTDYLFMLDATTWWMSADVENYAFDKNGGSYEFSINSYKSSQAWTVDSDSEDEWLTFSASDNVNSSNQYTGVTAVTATAKALPAGVTGRSSKVTFSYPGASTTVLFTQGETGVEDAVVDNSVAVVVDGDNFVVNATADVTRAEVYNVAGQKVAEAAVAGNATIDAAALANGVYIVKFNNGKAVKVVK